jgi:hypothetical protein
LGISYSTSQALSLRSPPAWFCKHSSVPHLYLLFPANPPSRSTPISPRSPQSSFLAFQPSHSVRIDPVTPASSATGLHTRITPTTNSRVLFPLICNTLDPRAWFISSITARPRRRNSSSSNSNNNNHNNPSTQARTHTRNKHRGAIHKITGFRTTTRTRALTARRVQRADTRPQTPET